jgi:hypothetical protein
MKKTLSIVFIAFLSVAVLSSFAPKKKKKAKSFKGSITYSLSYESSELSQVQLAKMPKSISVKVMGKCLVFKRFPVRW